MKKITLSILIICLGVSMLAQAPQAFKYQAVVRDNSGDVITGQLVSIRVSIMQDSINGVLVYSETHSSTTNQFGMLVLEIGKGTIETGVFDDINWGSTSQFLKLELDQTGGANYQFMGTSQLLSVPYSLNAGSLTLTSPDGANYEVAVDDDGALITNCTPMPTVANAGPDQVDVSSPTILEANTPINGSGLWTIVSGTGGNISNPADPATSFAGIADSSYTLRWTITTVCDSTYDEVNISFNAWLCGDSITDPRDGQTYKTVLIDSLCWMAENLNIGTMIPGDSNQTNNDIIEKYCYDNLESNCDIYGGLYQWNEMMQYATTKGTQGICPSGWNVPTDEQWKQLEGAVDSEYAYPDPEWDSLGWRGIDAGANLKSTSGWSSGGNGIDIFGFNTLPGGYRDQNGNFMDITNSAHFWTSSVSGAKTDEAYERRVEMGQTVWQAIFGFLLGGGAQCVQWVDEVYYETYVYPSRPYNPSPADGSLDQPINATLSWTCSDPQGDQLTYDVYFGDSYPLTLVSEGQTETTYDPGPINPNTTYHWKIKAKKADNPFYYQVGKTWHFTTEYLSWQCGDVFTDPRDGQDYLTIDLGGGVCVFAENLNFETGTSWCYNNDQANCDIHGRLYDHAIAQIACPPGTHLPSDEEFKYMEGFCDSQYIIGDPIWNLFSWRGSDVGTNWKSTDGWAYGGNGTDTFDFTVLPSGRYNPGFNNFYELTYGAYFWTATEGPPGQAFYRYLSTGIPMVFRGQTDSTVGYSVRCIVD